MRYAFGLVSLLVVTAIIVYAFSKYEIPVAKKGLETREQVQPLVGQTSDGIRAQDSVKVDGQMLNGQLRSLLVTSVTPGGFFEQYYGLKVGDKVLQINAVDVGALGDAGMAESMLWSVKAPQTIAVLRNGQPLTLNVSDGSLATPAIGGGASAPAGGPTPATPGTPTPPATPAPGGTSIPGLPSSIQVPNQ